MNKVGQRTLGLAAILCASSCLSTPAWADNDLQTPPPVFQHIDKNGVDLVTGDFNRSVVELSIGSGDTGGLAYMRAFVGDGWTDNITGIVSINHVLLLTIATVSIGNTSARFNCSSSPCVSFEQRGAALVFDSNFYTYTSPSGAVAVFPIHHFSETNHPEIAGRIETLTYPNGDGLNFTYKTAACSGCGTAVRLQSVVNNRGYQLKIHYHIDDDNINSTQFDAWTTRRSVTALNMGEEYCDPLALSCPNFTPAWPVVKYSPPSTTTTTVTDPASRATTYTYNGAGQITRIHRPDSLSEDDLVVSYTSGKVSRVDNGTGHWDYTYADVGTIRTTTTTDPNGYPRITTSDITDPDRPLVTSDRKGSLNTTSYEYDVKGRVTRITAPEGQGTTPDSDYTQFAYDDRGNITHTRVVGKAGTGPSDIIVDADYDTTCSSPITCNKPNSTTDANGYRTNFTYDPTHGGVVSVKLPAPTGTTPVGSGTRPETRLSYTLKFPRFKNASGTIVNGPKPVYVLTGASVCAEGSPGSSPSCLGTASESIATIAYANNADGSNNLLPTSVTSASGNTSGPGAVSSPIAATYDPIGNPQSVDGPLSGSADSVNYRYDADRELTGLIGPDPDGAITHNKYRAMTIDYNPDGQPTAVTRGTTLSATDFTNFAPLQELDTDYDGIGRKIKDTVVMNSHNQIITQYSYDEGNRPICTAQRLTLTSLPSDPCLPDTGLLDRITKIQYNAADQVTKIKTALNTPLQSEVDYTHTDNGKVETVTEPVIGTVTGAQPSLTTFVYDDFDRLMKVRYPKPNLTGSGAGTSSTTDFQLYTFDPMSRVIDVRRRDGTHIGLIRDNLGRLATKNVPGTVNDVSFGYDNLGQMTSAATSDQALSFHYDALGRNVDQVSPLGTVRYEYDAAGNRTKMTWPDSVFVTYDIDNSSEVTAIREAGAASGVRVLAQYVFDDLGRRTELDRGNGVDSTFTFTGPWLTKLIQAVDAPNAQTLNFDNNAVGQITSRSSNNDAYAWGEAFNVDRIYTPNGLNQLTTSGPLNLTYDDLGNLTSDGVDTYDYDNEGHLITVTGAATLRYDPLGRLTKTTGSATTQYLYDGNDLIAEYNSSGAMVLQRYVHGPDADEPLVWYQGSDVTNRRWMIADQQGTITAITDSTGAATNINTYDDYGAPGPDNVGRFQYTGQTWLADAGVYYYKARTYSPALGRFMQTDPAGYVNGMNLYAYVGNDPINGTDPTGMDLCAFALSCCTGETVAVGDLQAQVTACRLGFGAHDLGGNSDSLTGIPNLGGFFGGGGSGGSPGSSSLAAGCLTSSDLNPALDAVNLAKDSIESMSGGASSAIVAGKFLGRATPALEGLAKGSESLALWAGLAIEVAHVGYDVYHGVPGGVAVAGALGRAFGSAKGAAVGATVGLIAGATIGAAAPPTEAGTIPVGVVSGAIIGATLAGYTGVTERSQNDFEAAVINTFGCI